MEHDQIVEFLSQSSPLLSEAAGLLAQTSLRSAGLQETDPNRKGGSAGKIRVDGSSIAGRVTEQAPVVSEAAPDLALAAPDYAVAA